MPARSEMSEQEIDAALADSYPASDPPSWTLGIERAETTEAEIANRGARICRTPPALLRIV